MRAETQAPHAEASPELQAVLAGRDAVTAALARSDPGVSTLLADAQRRLRSALGYAVPAGPGGVSR